jgi:hypothetical protein
MALKLRQGLSTDRTTITPESGEILYTTDTKALYVGDGTTAGGNAISSGGGGSGTVTSVGGTGTISGISLSGTVTTSGNLTLGGTLAVTPSNFASQTANTVLSAPNGTNGTPTFRALAVADIPTLNQNTTGTASNVTGTVAVANGGTGTTTPSLVAGTNVTITGTWPNQTIAAAGGGGGSGTVTSVNATVPAFLSVSGGPITTSGTLAISYSGTALPIANGGTGATTQQAAINALAGSVQNSRFLAGDGTNVTMRVIAVGDVPTLNQNTTGTAANVTGTVAIANGGTGQTTASAGFNALSPVTTTGDLILGNGANSATRLPIGTDGQILTSDGSTAAWGSKINSATAVASTSGTSIDFTSIPSWVKRITLMFSGVSTNGTNIIYAQLGTGAGPTFVATGYNSPFMTTAATTMNTQLTTVGFSIINPNAAANLHSGTFILTNLSGNTWTGFGSCGTTSGTRMFLTSGAIALGAALTAVRISTADTFDAGTINILYE